MRIHKIDTEAGTAIIELDRASIGRISNLMHDAKCTGPVRAHFYLLYEILSHKSFDSVSLTMGNNILTGKLKGGAEEE